jgi:7-cyano-7-deazaguanine synthase
MPQKHAVVLLSGGLDSATVLAIAKSRGFVLHALSFDYGQRHQFELQCARAQADLQGVQRHIVPKIDLAAFGGSALTSDIPVPMDRRESEMATGIPVTYVPARNTVFLSYALGLAEVTGSFDIFIGVNAVDYSGYPDCRPAFISAFETLANLATKAGVEGAGRFTIHTPLIDMTKAQIIQTGLDLNVDFSKTHTCYNPDAQGRSCGRCDACKLRLKGFADLGRTDPARYQSAK